MGLTFDKDCIILKTKSNWKKYIQLSTKSQLWTYIQIPFPQIIQDKTLPHQIRLNPSWIWFQIDYVYIENETQNILSGILKERSEVQKPPTKWIWIEQ